MKTVKLQDFIKKYNLAGALDDVKWTVKDGDISAVGISEDASLVGYVSMVGVDLPDGVYGVCESRTLLKAFGMVGPSIESKYIKRPSSKVPVAVIFDDGNIEVTYALHELNTLSKMPEKDDIPKEWEIEVTLDKDTVSNFIKAVNSLNSDAFTLVYSSGVLKMVVGHSTSNSNRISFPVEATVGVQTMKPISFSAESLKQIVLANGDVDDLVLCVNERGIAKVEVSADDFSAEYYLVQVDDE